MLDFLTLLRPRTIPGIRQLHFEMRLKYPDDVFTKMLDTFKMLV